MAVVYLHKRNDTNEVFYVGIGKTPRRAFSKSKRSIHWYNVVNKVGYTVDILHNDVSWDEACELEKHLIFLYGRKDLGLGTLVNMTDGGEGNNNIIFSEESRQKMSESGKGRISPNKGKTLSEETRQKIGAAGKGRTFSDETKNKISETLKGKLKSEEIKQKISLFQRNKEGVKGYFYDKRRSKYLAQIKVGDKRIYLGCFKTPSEAEEAYKNARVRYFA